MSSSALHGLIETKKAVEQYGGDLAFCAVSEQLMALFQVVHLEKTFQIYASETEALHSWGEE